MGIKEPCDGLSTFGEDDSVKLNLGCGSNPLEGYTNVDKWGPCDLLVDLDGPWPWVDSCVEEVRADYSFSELGQSFDEYCTMLRDLYRVCKDGAQVHITVYHPRSEAFLNNPANVRAVTPDSLTPLSQQAARELRDGKAVQCPLALRIGVDFRLTSVSALPMPGWAGELPENLKRASESVNNVVQEYKMTLTVKK